MGKSTSCFKIITCGNDSADKDDLEAPEVSDWFTVSAFWFSLTFHFWLVSVGSILLGSAVLF